MKDKQIKIDYSFSLYKVVRRTAILAIFAILAFYLYDKNKAYEELVQLNKVATEDLQVSRNKNGELVAKIGSFETQRTEDFIKFASKDSLTLALQREVRNMRKYLKKQGSVTNFSSESNITTSSGTQVSSDKSGSPVYKSDFDLGGWIFGKSVATKDSTYYDIGYKDKYSLTVGIEPQGFWGLGKGKPFVEVTSSNPYNTVKTLKTYQVGLPKEKRFGVGPNISLSPSFANNSMQIKATVGIGIQYNIIKF